MMKKFLACLTVFSLISSSAAARPFHFHHDFHRPAPVVIHKKHHFHPGLPVLAAASGIIGFALGAGSTVKTQTVYSVPTTQNSGQCFAVVSKSTGKVTQHCLGGNNQVLYVD